jgi:hypothetical protein
MPTNRHPRYRLATRRPTLPTGIGLDDEDEEGGEGETPAEPPRPPRGLEKPERELWGQFVSAHVFAPDDFAGLELLRAAMQAHARMCRARAKVDAAGETFVDPKGTLRPHPAGTIELSARNQYVAILKRLGLDLEPVGRPGRPPLGPPMYPRR